MDKSQVDYLYKAVPADLEEMNVFFSALEISSKQDADLFSWGNFTQCTQS